ncbi:hypothetical protein F5Y17DRAFT_448065 [Xylariaceae sp. FL0594]|nr:hypothetical protein F5Y17DRAFT_448065 [Xylariaceae sp. FL0594]
MSAFGRNYLPLGFAIVFGVVNGFYAFQPLLKAKQEGLGLPSQNEQQKKSISSEDISSR